jgi:hypothetical protein
MRTPCPYADSMRLDQRLWDPSRPDSLSTRYRRRRWKRLAERFPDLDEMRVLDIGGTLNSWRLAPTRPKQLVLLNLSFERYQEDDRVVTMVGDACDPPVALSTEHFDLIYSNSVIEHVGGHWRRERFADTVHRFAEHHWIQTPYRYFPIEPHWLFPFFQHLSVRAKAEVTARWRAGSYARVGSVAEAIPHALEIELIDVTTMSHYFPRSTIVREKAAGLTKSLVAVR